MYLRFVPIWELSCGGALLLEKGELEEEVKEERGSSDSMWRRIRWRRKREKEEQKDVVDGKDFPPFFIVLLYTQSPLWLYINHNPAH